MSLKAKCNSSGLFVLNIMEKIQAMTSLGRKLFLKYFLLSRKILTDLKQTPYLKSEDKDRSRLYTMSLEVSS